MIDLPQPLTPPDCDCTDLDGFMLNVERLMASELVALNSHEIIAAALFVWCRAWKQRPAASLPDDDRVVAAFSRLPIAKFKRHRQEIMRGFVKCADGRLYHKTLAEEAVRAFERKLAFHRKRAADNERIKKWRKNKHETHDDIHNDTPDVTRNVAEGQGRDRDGTVREEVPIAEAIGRRSADILDFAGKPDWWPVRDRYGRVQTEVSDKIIFDTGKAVLGKSSGGQINKLLQIQKYKNDRRAALELILRADDASAPGAWFAAALRKAQIDEPELAMHEKYPEQEYRA